jgi:protein tyrosine/serine phosphatase
LTQWFQRRRLKTDNTLFDTFGPLVSFKYKNVFPNQQQKNITFLEDHPMNIPTKISSNLPTGFREEDKKTQHSF